MSQAMHLRDVQTWLCCRRLLFRVLRMTFSISKMGVTWVGSRAILSLYLHFVQLRVLCGEVCGGVIMTSGSVMSALQRWSCRFLGFLWAVMNFVFSNMSVSNGKSMQACVKALWMAFVKFGTFGWYVTTRGRVAGGVVLIGGVSVGEGTCE